MLSFYQMKGKDMETNSKRTARLFAIIGLISLALFAPSRLQLRDY